MKNALLYLGIVVILAAGGMFYFAREAYEDDQLSIALDCFAGVDCGASPSLTWWPAALVALVGAGMIYASTKVKSDTPDG